MIKMMVTVVIVFTICWLPFNIFLLLLYDTNFVIWDMIPYLWFVFHWLAMSHSCYNPVIYCYMNARFRSGFMQILQYIPFLRRCCCMQRCMNNSNCNGRSGRNGSCMGTNFALTGADEQSQLHRVNTSTTFISTRRKTNNSIMAPYTNCTGDHSLIR